MTPAAAREQLYQRALRADRERQWLASCAHVALAWRRDDDGTMHARGPTSAEVDAIARHAGDVDRVVVDAALTLLRRIAAG